MRNAPLLIASTLCLWLAIGAVSEAWITLKETELLDAMKEHHRKQTEALDVLMRAVPESPKPQPAAGSRESIELEKALSPLYKIDITRWPCVEAIADEILQPGDFTAERLARIRKMREDCVKR